MEIYWVYMIYFKSNRLSPVNSGSPLVFCSTTIGPWDQPETSLFSWCIPSIQQRPVIPTLRKTVTFQSAIQIEDFTFRSLSLCQMSYADTTSVLPLCVSVVWNPWLVMPVTFYGNREGNTCMSLKTTNMQPQFTVRPTIHIHICKCPNTQG